MPTDHSSPKVYIDTPYLHTHFPTRVSRHERSITASSLCHELSLTQTNSETLINIMSKHAEHDLPAFDALTLSKDGPKGNAWGLFGPSDQLGMLNLLTPKTVAAAAAKEIREGVRISLDWPLNKPSFPSFGRDPYKHRIVNKAPRTVNDDVLTFNTQCSSQWDGFRHYGQGLHVVR